VRNLPMAQVILVVLLLVLGLLDVLARALRKRAGDQPAPPLEVEEEYELVEPERELEVPVVLVPPRERARVVRSRTPAAEELVAAAKRERMLASPAVDDVAQPHRALRRTTGVRLGGNWLSLGPREARRAVVLMEVLGPCRGLEPASDSTSRRPQVVE
jgi:hypothetical protein